MNFWNTLSDGLGASFTNLGVGILNFLPDLIIAVLVVVIGWVVGSLLGRVVAQVIKAVKLDDALTKAGVADIVKRGGMTLNTGRFIGTLVEWFFIVVFLIAALDILGLSQVNIFLSTVVVFYVPKVIVAILILLLAAVVADVMQKIVVTSARTAEFRSAHLLGAVTRWVIWIFGFLVALTHLGIAEALIQTIVTGVVVALSLALGLAFGLGGQDAASRFIEKTRQEITK
jgi:small-conductance mechanosensitive channel